MNKTPKIRKPDKIPILIVDDEPPITEMLRQALGKSGYECHVANSGAEGLSILENHPVDVLITDIRMPGMDGVELLKKAKSAHNIDVMVMTGFTEDYNYESIISAGANDFIHKPISIRELVIRLKRVIRERYLLIERDQINEELEDTVLQLKKYANELEIAHAELQDAYLDTINRLAIAAEFKDEDTGDHIIRMSRYCALIAEKMEMPDEDVQKILYASPMHDIGKIGIPDNILLKPGRLTDEEFEVIKTHTTIGASILAKAKADVLKLAQEIAMTHHEKWNGKGYPHGLSRTDIPMAGRIVGIADTFDALTSQRPYKKPYPVEIAIDIIKKERGEHFDPDVVDVFLANIDAVIDIKEEIGSQSIPSLADFVWSERDRADEIDKTISIRQ